MHGPSPTSNFGRSRSSSPLSIRPWPLGYNRDGHAAHGIVFVALQSFSFFRIFFLNCVKNKKIQRSIFFLHFIEKLPFLGVFVHVRCLLVLVVVISRSVNSGGGLGGRNPQILGWGIVGVTGSVVGSRGRVVKYYHILSCLI